ncbi:Putative SNAP25 homologous protein SNAP30 [Linum perenne]
MFGFLKAAPPANPDPPPANPDPAPRRTSSEPMKIDSDSDSDDEVQKWRKKPSAAEKKKYENGFQDSGGLESQSVQELESYAVYKAEETTSTVNNCLKIADDIRGDASKTLDMLHAQGDQIQRTHEMAVDMDKDLGKGEKLLNSLGGMFSKPWKPKKTKKINGPVITEDKTSRKNASHRAQREKLGIGSKPGAKSAPVTPPNEPRNAMQKVEMEKAKQDDGLSDLSDILGDLKGMAVDMGSELDRQNKALDHLDGDIDELNSRVKGANQRARHLLSK